MSHKYVNGQLFYSLDGLLIVNDFWLNEDGTMALHGDKPKPIDHMDCRNNKGKRQYANLHIIYLGKDYHYPIHRLVCQLHQTVPANFSEYDVHHIDGNEHNNHPSNLIVLKPNIHKAWHKIKRAYPDYKWEDFIQLSDDDKMTALHKEYINRQSKVCMNLSKPSKLDIMMMFG